MTKFNAEGFIKNISESLSLFHNNQKITYAYDTITSKTYPIMSEQFRSWLENESLKISIIAPLDQTMKRVQNTLRATAQFKGDLAEAYNRIGNNAGNIYIDPHDAAGNIIIISPDNVFLQKTNACRFWRPDNSFALPLPDLTAELSAIDELKPHINFGSEENWVLIVAYLVAAIVLENSYPILVLSGEQGCAKTFTSKTLVNLIDPVKAPLLEAPNSTEDIMVHANNRRVLCYDNISGIKANLSDTLCRVATSGGIGIRKKYTDGDMFVVDVTRPIILNGIDVAANRADLASRCLFIDLPRIESNKYVAEHTLQSKIKELTPRFLGALYLLISKVLACKDQIILEESTRLADFTKIGMAVEQAIGWETGTFWKAYNSNQAGYNRIIFENDPLIIGILEIVHDEPFIGTMGELLKTLEELDMNQKYDKRRYMSKTASHLSTALKRVAPTMRSHGMVYEQLKRTSDKRSFIIARDEEQKAQWDAHIDKQAEMYTAKDMNLTEHLGDEIPF